MLKAWNELDVSHDLPIQSQYYYHNSNILGENGDTLPVYNCFAELKIKQVKELSLKRGKAGYNGEVYNAVKHINSRVPDRHQTNNDLVNHDIKAGKKTSYLKNQYEGGLSQNGRESNCRQKV